MVSILKRDKSQYPRIPHEIDLCKNQYKSQQCSHQGQKNSGWFFKNTGTEVHSLSPLPENRISIIVNYVNSTWKDEKVLV